jgi:GNAT superfamily N-acetyltransferase
MSKFVLTAGAGDIATQIADMINDGGQLWARLNKNSILFSQTKYIIELDGEVVIGVVGLDQYGLVTELKHLCVHPNYRRRGLGRKLLEKGIGLSTTEFIYGAVGSDNHVNIRNNLRVGMRPIGKRWSRGRYIIIFARRKNGYNGHIHSRRAKGY